MAKTIFEQMGGTYTQVGDYLIPNLKLPAEEAQANIGVWGMRHKRFLKENHRVLYAILKGISDLNHSEKITVRNQYRGVLLWRETA